MREKSGQEATYRQRGYRERRPLHTLLTWGEGLRGEGTEDRAVKAALEGRTEGQVQTAQLSWGDCLPIQVFF